MAGCGLLLSLFFYALRWIQGFVGNWGFSIILLTMGIKLLFFHLSAASYRSMARMRKLQPRIVQLRERYSSDKQRMNQAMMELYKTEKINPLGGCLPILVQIPVFISLYWVLLESVELRHSPFIGWITDLSDYDPYFVLPSTDGCEHVLSAAFESGTAGSNASEDHDDVADCVHILVPVLPVRIGVVLVRQQLVVYRPAMGHYSQNCGS